MRVDGMGGSRRGSARESEGAVIIDAAAKRMVLVNTTRKTYTEMTEADFQRMKAGLGQARARMAEQMKNMPPEQREKMEKMMGGLFAGGAVGSELPEVAYEPLGKKKTIAGFGCEVYRVSIGGKARSESCIAPWSSTIITKADVEQLKKMAADLQKMMDSIPNMPRQQDWTRVPGIPIEEIHLGADGKPDWTSTLTSVDRGPVPKSTFEPPAGFTKQAMPAIGPGGPMGGGPPPGKP